MKLKLFTGEFEQFIAEIKSREKSAGEFWLRVQRYSYNRECHELTKLRISPPVPEDDYEIQDFEIPDNPIRVYP